MDEIAEPTPAKIKKAKWVYWTAYITSCVLLLALWVAGFHYGKLGFLLPNLGDFGNALRNLCPGSIFPLLAEYIAVAVCRRVGVSLEMRFQDIIFFREDSLFARSKKKPTRFNSDTICAMAKVASSFVTAICMLTILMFPAKELISLIFAGAALCVLGACSLYEWWRGKNCFFQINSVGVSLTQKVPWNNRPPGITSWQWSEIDQIVVSRSRTIFGHLGPLHLLVFQRGTNKWLTFNVNPSCTKTFQPVLNWVQSERTRLCATPVEEVSSATPVEKLADIVRTPLTTVNEPEVLIARHR